MPANNTDPNNPVEVSTVTPTNLVVSWFKRLLGVEILATMIFAGLVTGVVLLARQSMAQDALNAGVRVVEPVLAEQRLIKADLSEHKSDSAQTHRFEKEEMATIKSHIQNLQITSIETNANVKLLLLEKGLTPVSLTPSLDGGR